MQDKLANSAKELIPTTPEESELCQRSSSMSNLLVLGDHQNSIKCAHSASDILDIPSKEEDVAADMEQGREMGEGHSASNSFSMDDDSVQQTIEHQHELAKKAREHLYQSFLLG